MIKEIAGFAYDCKNADALADLNPSLSDRKIRNY